jgi:hypothetical protein
LRGLHGSSAPRGDSDGDKAVFGTIVGGGTGALWGTLIGAFVHARPVVYQAQTPKAAVSPTLGPGRGEVTLSVTF